MKAWIGYCVVALLWACGGPAKSADDVSTTDTDGDDVVDKDDKCPKVAARDRKDGCPEPTQLTLSGAGTFEPAPGEKRKFDVAVSGEAPHDLKSSAQGMKLKGTITYKDAAGTNKTASVDLEGGLEAKQDESSRPFSFVDAQTGVVVWQTDSKVENHSSLWPVRLKLSAGVIPENARVRYGVAASFMRAAFNGVGKEGDPELEGYTPFDSFEVGFMGKYFLWNPGEKHWLGLGVEAGAAFIERVSATAKDPACVGKNCTFVYPASVEAYGGISFDYAIGARADGGFHLTLQPTLYSSHADKTRLLVPIAIGFEF